MYIILFFFVSSIAFAQTNRITLEEDSSDLISSVRKCVASPSRKFIALTHDEHHCTVFNAYGKSIAKFRYDDDLLDSFEVHYNKNSDRYNTYLRYFSNQLPYNLPKEYIEKFREKNPSLAEPFILGKNIVVFGNDTILPVPKEDRAKSFKQKYTNILFENDSILHIGVMISIAVADKKRLDNINNLITKNFNGILRYNIYNQRKTVTWILPTKFDTLFTIVVNQPLWTFCFSDRKKNEYWYNYQLVTYKLYEDVNIINEIPVFCKINQSGELVETKKTKLHDYKSKYYSENGESYLCVAGENEYVVHPYIDSIFMFTDNNAIRSFPLVNVRRVAEVQKALIPPKNRNSIISEKGGYITMTNVLPSKNSGNIIVLMFEVINRDTYQYVAQEYNSHGQLISSYRLENNPQKRETLVGYDPHSHSAISTVATDEEGWVMSFYPLQ